MSYIESILRIPSLPRLSDLLLILVLLLALYLARHFFHLTIRALSRTVHNAMRMAAVSVLIAEKRIAARNRQVLIAKGLENSERKLTLAFDQINTAAIRNLRGYAELHRQISGVITKLEDDHRNSMDVPPSLPNWTPIIEAIAKIEHSGDTMAASMLSEINSTLIKQHQAAIEDYRMSTTTRHKILNKMFPLWSKMEKTLREVDNSVISLTDRAKSIDRHMQTYGQIRANSDQAARVMASSSLTQFFISGLFLIVAFGGVVVNFNLLALPMSEMIGAGSHIGPYKTAEVAAGVITAMELSLGLFLMESLRLTRLFPVIGSMDEKMRHRMIWISLTLLTVIAGVESALAVLRYQMATDMEALRPLMAGVEKTEVSTRIIPTAGHVIIGFILPFWMAFGAIPLAVFISSARTVLGIIAAGGLRLLAFGLRLVGNIVVYAGQVTITVYDLVIFPTLWLEGTLRGSHNKVKPSQKQPSRFGFLKTSKNAIKNKNETIALKERQE